MNEVVVAGNEMMEPIRIAPENLRVAESYLHNGSIESVCTALCLPADLVADILNTREVRKFIDTVYLDVGYRNRAKLGSALDAVIDAKLLEMDEAEVTSSKDIADLLQLAHKFRIEELKMQVKMHEAPAIVAPGSTVVNIQDNSESGGNYGSLLAKLMK